MPAGLFAFVTLVIVFFLYQIVGGTITFLLFGLNLTGSDVTAVRLATMVGQILFLLVPTVILAKLRFPNLNNVFRFGPIDVRQIVLVLVAVFALQQMLQGYMITQESIPVEFPPVIQKLLDQVKEMMEQMYRLLTSADSFAEFVFVVVVIAVTPAVCEEMLFRGLVQRTLEDSKDVNMSSSDRRQKGISAAVVTGIVFALYHLNPFTLVPLAALGVFFGLVMYRTQNIMTAVIAHFFNNFLACLAVYLQFDDSFVAFSPVETPSPEMLMLNFAVFTLVFVIAAYYLVRITHRTDTDSTEVAPL